MYYYLLQMIVFIVLWLWIVVGYILLLIAPSAYTSELVLSFFPYILLLLALFIVIFISYWIYFLVKKSSYFFSFIIFILTISLWYIGFMMYLQYTSFYSLDTNTTISSGNQSISFLYANIYYKNNSFSWLIQTIEKYNPDIILFVEYAKIHDDWISAMLEEEYPYMNRSIGGKHYDGDIVFSRYPLKKIEHEFDRWSRSFSHILIYPDKALPIDISLVHTSAPVSVEFFEMRNEQLKKLVISLKEYYRNSESNTFSLRRIVIGDMNITPWSYFYPQIDRSFVDLWLINYLSDSKYAISFSKTWCHQYLSFLCAHIDHLWYSGTELHTSIVPLPWSDHDAIFGIL